MNKLQRNIQRLRAKGATDEQIKQLVNVWLTKRK